MKAQALNKQQEAHANDKAAKHFYRQSYGLLLGELANQPGANVSEIARKLHKSRGYVRYWQKKDQDPTFSAGSWGGFRYFTFIFYFYFFCPDPTPHSFAQRPVFAVWRYG
jgi:hypothetical protein